MSFTRNFLLCINIKSLNFDINIKFYFFVARELYFWKPFTHSECLTLLHVHLPAGAPTDSPTRCRIQNDPTTPRAPRCCITWVVHPPPHRKFRLCWALFIGSFILIYLHTFHGRTQTAWWLRLRWWPMAAVSSSCLPTGKKFRTNKYQQLWEHRNVSPSSNRCSMPNTWGVVRPHHNLLPAALHDASCRRPPDENLRQQLSC